MQTRQLVVLSLARMQLAAPHARIVVVILLEGKTDAPAVLGLKLLKLLFLEFFHLPEGHFPLPLDFFLSLLDAPLLFLGGLLLQHFLRRVVHAA